MLWWSEDAPRLKPKDFRRLRMGRRVLGAGENGQCSFTGLGLLAPRERGKRELERTRYATLWATLFNQSFLDSTRTLNGFCASRMLAANAHDTPTSHCSGSSAASGSLLPRCAIDAPWMHWIHHFIVGSICFHGVSRCSPDMCWPIPDDHPSLPQSKGHGTVILVESGVTVVLAPEATLGVGTPSHFGWLSVREAVMTLEPLGGTLGPPVTRPCPDAAWLQYNLQRNMYLSSPLPRPHLIQGNASKMVLMYSIMVCWNGWR